MTRRPRAAIVVTGSELVGVGPPGPERAVPRRRGRAPRARSRAHHGRRRPPSDLEPALAQGLEADLCLVSGGLGPTHDDRTVEAVARVAGKELVVDEGLEREIEAVSRMIAERLRRPYTDFTTGVRKQATLPEGGISLGLAGRRPGSCCRRARARS